MALSLGPALRRRGITQAKLAAEIGISKGFMSQIISGKKQPSMETLERIMSALNAAPSELYDTAPEGAQDVHEMAEGQAALITGPAMAQGLQAFGDLSKALAAPGVFEAKSDMFPFGIFAQDLLLVDLGGKTRNMDLAIVTIAVPDTGAATTVVRRIVGNMLMSGSSMHDLLAADSDDQSVAILGRLCAVLRPSVR